METKALQQQIHANTRARGYVDPYLPEVFQARQIAKMQEELAEFMRTYRGLPAFVGIDIDQAGITCRGNFDNPGLWEGAYCADPEQAKRELYDMGTVLLNLFESMGLDIADCQGKSAADVQRGVR